MRDDFSQRTKDLLANRVGWKCSNPNCRKASWKYIKVQQMMMRY